MDEDVVMMAAVALARCHGVEWMADDILVVKVTTRRGEVEHPVTLDVLEELERRKYLTLSDDAPADTHVGRVTVEERCRHWAKRWLDKKKMDVF